MLAHVLTFPILLGPGPAPLAVLDPTPQDEKPKVELFTPTTAAEPIATTSVGMRVRVDQIVIPGSDLRAKPVADPGRADVLVRVLKVAPHGSDRRYNLEIAPQVEGEIDLRDHLERVDGSSMANIPELRVIVDAVAPPDQVVPNELEIPSPSGVGGYRTLMIAAGVFWVLGLLALIFVGRKRKSDDPDAIDAPPVTLADRMRPLVERAGRGDLSTAERAELERLVLAHWRGERDLSDVPVADAVSRLRTDDEAGPLLVRLEEWFHRPGAAEPSEAEVRELLAPYRDVPANGRATVAGGAA